METEAEPLQEFPRLYREILDGVALLEQSGERREAQLVRAAAIASYSTAWNEKSRRQLLGLIRRIDGVVAGRQRPRRHSRGLLVLRRAVQLGR